MLVHAPVPTGPFAAPWAASLNARMTVLDGPGPRVAYFYETPDQSTFRYRVHNMIEALGSRPGRRIAAAWFCAADLDLSEQVMDRADVVVFCRARYSARLARIAMRAKARGARVLYDCDDLVFDVNRTTAVLSSIAVSAAREEHLDFWFAIMARNGALMRLCDAAIVTNAALAREVRASGLATDVRIVPNFLNRHQQDVSARLFSAKMDAGFASDGRVTLGYFSGSPTHRNDFAVVVGALRRLLDVDRTVRLRLVGHFAVPPALEAYGSRIERLPMQNFIDLQKRIGEVEINIVPLQDTAFTRCKSELKVFEAAAVGTVTVAAKVGTLPDCLRHGSTGFLAYAHEWDAALAAARALVDRPRDYRDMACLAREAALEAFGWDRHAEAIAQAVLG